ncbi:hypothetical protein PPS11_37440 [Pseudomonas putida S11]|nr:hypothetical protein PPS11_37440 [Pseudomonas putida S11]
MQVVTLHVAGHLAIQVQLVQVPAAVVQVVDLAAIRQGQRSQVAERIVLVAERAVGGDFFGQPPQQVVGVLWLLLSHPELYVIPPNYKRFI